MWQGLVILNLCLEEQMIQWASMPKLIDETVAEVKPKKERAPRKRAESSRAPRKRVSKKLPENEVVLETAEAESTTPLSSTNKRKAPTRLKEEKAETAKIAEEGKKSWRKLYVIGGLFVVSLGVAATIGFSDNGQIDVSSVVAIRNARVASGNINPETDGASPNSIVVPVQNSETQMIDGGLQRSSEPPALETTSQGAMTEQASSSATSTDATQVSSSTETVGDDTASSEIQNESREGELPADSVSPTASTTGDASLN